MLSHVFEAFDGADENGYYTFTVPHQWVYQELPPNKKEALRDLIESHFYVLRMFTLRLTQVKKWIGDIEAAGDADAEGNWTIRLNLAKFFLLPAEAPSQELTELRAWFEAMKPFFETNSDVRSGIQICNNRDNNGRVFGSLSCWTKDGDSASEDDLEATTRLTAIIDASPALSGFLRNLALTLQKLGPWSWATITEEVLYGDFSGPARQKRLQKIMAEQAAQEEESVEAR